MIMEKICFIFHFLKAKHSWMSEFKRHILVWKDSAFSLEYSACFKLDLSKWHLSNRNPSLAYIPLEPNKPIQVAQFGQKTLAPITLKGWHFLIRNIQKLRRPIEPSRTISVFIQSCPE